MTREPARPLDWRPGADPSVADVVGDRFGPQVVARSVDFGERRVWVVGGARLGQAQADARKAQADQQVARQALERQRELHAAGIVADKDWQQTQAEAARAQAEADRASRRLAGLGGAPKLAAYSAARRRLRALSARATARRARSR